MAVTTLDISMSLDSFIAGPNQTVEEPLGEGGLQLHEWIFGLASWRERHGQSGGVTNADSGVLQESVEATGAVVMGRRMFSGGEGPWENDPVAGGWWGAVPLLTAALQSRMRGTATPGHHRWASSRACATRSRMVAIPR